MNFPFNQPDKTSDCGYRCMFYAMKNVDSGYDLAVYSDWLDQFKLFQPVKSGIMFSDICTVLDSLSIDFRFTHLTDKGLYIVYSGVWLKPEGKNHGHYFVYHDGIVYCSTHSEPYAMPLEEVQKRLEAKSVDGSFRCLKILGRKTQEEPCKS